MAAKSEFKSESLVWAFFSILLFVIFVRDVKRGQKNKGPRGYSIALLHSHLKRWHATKYVSANAGFKKNREEQKASGSLTPKEQTLKEIQIVQMTL